MEHGTRPATIGLVLSSSPIALLAWIGEKFQQWTDQDPPMDEILDSVTLYWLTQSFPRSIYPYRQTNVDRRLFHTDPDYRVKKPSGFSWFPMELAPMPKAWIEGTMNLKSWKAHEKVMSAWFFSTEHELTFWQGGHFAAMENPDLLLEDVEEFISQHWTKASRL